MTNEVTLKDLADTLEMLKFHAVFISVMVSCILGYLGKITSGK